MTATQTAPRRTERGKAATEIRKSLAKAQRRKVFKKKIRPNLALLASWRDEYPNPRVQFAKNLRSARKLRVIVIQSSQKSPWKNRHNEKIWSKKCKRAV
jgi:hypothetical protein